MTTFTIRSATAADTGALDTLAALDSARTPAAPLLLAERDGRLIAALSTADGAAVADPFTHSAEAVELLRERARQLHPARAPRRHGLAGLRAARV